MARVLRRCPKCSRKITNKIECKNCGLIFERYFKAEAHKRAEEKVRKEEKAKLRTIINSTISLLLVVTLAGLATYYFMTRPPETATVKTSTSPTTSERSSSPTSAQQVPESVQRAMQATVAISSPSGNGTGFFVARDLLVTSRSVVEQKTTGLAEARTTFETFRDKVAAENEKLEAMKQQFAEMEDSAAREELAAVIEDGDQQLARALSHQKKLEENVAAIEARQADQSVQVILNDGSQKEVSEIVYSDSADLALVSVIDANNEAIALPPEDAVLKEGNGLFMIGPKNTSQAASFIGYYQGDSPEHYYLITNRPFNKSNIGGPIIDESGYIRGISVITGFEASGNGHAIPLPTIRAEFNL